MYLLPTSCPSCAKAGPSRSQNVCTWASGVPIGQLFISAISLMELEIGVLRLERSHLARPALLSLKLLSKPAYSASCSDFPAFAE